MPNNSPGGPSPDAGRSVVVSVTARRPAHRALHRVARLLFGGRIRRAVVERHRDVGAERELHVHRVFGREAHRAAVDGRAELHALLGDLAQRFEAEHLEAAGVGEDRTAPVHEAVQPAVRAHDLVARPQHQVKGVAEHDVGAEALELFGRHRLDRAVGAHGHEGRRLDHAVRELRAGRGARRPRCLTR